MGKQTTESKRFVHFSRILLIEVVESFQIRLPYRFE